MRPPALVATATAAVAGLRLGVAMGVMPKACWFQQCWLYAQLDHHLLLVCSVACKSQMMGSY